MRQKELRIALVCYGGVSLAVYMHGVTKELWRASRASRASHAGEPSEGNSEAVYRALIDHVMAEHDLHLRVLPDIFSGSSAGGINAVFLAQAIYSGQSLEPLTDLWLDNADVEELVHPDARPVWRFAKFWAQPIVEWVLRRPGSAVSESVAPETRSEVRRKVSRFIRGRWFEPPFSGRNFSGLLFDGFMAMREGKPGQPLLPPGHPIDLFVTATDFRGYQELLRLNSPPVVEESEHRMPIGFRANTPASGGKDLASLLELTFAARATASFPGAFPPLMLGEIDGLSQDREFDWQSRQEFLERIMPVHLRNEQTENVSLIDGSVLVNKPFGSAMDALAGRPVHREVDRRFVYIDPRPDRFQSIKQEQGQSVGFFEAIFGSLSVIPREQPIRENLDALDQQSRDAERLVRIVEGLRPEVDRAVEKLFGLTFFLDRPTPRRLETWRGKAQQAAAENAGYAFHSYIQAKFAGIVERLATLAFKVAPGLALPDCRAIEQALRMELSNRGLDTLASKTGGANEDAIRFFHTHDLGFRIRRLRLLTRRLTHDWQVDPEVPDEALDSARAGIYEILSLYILRDRHIVQSDEFILLANNALTDPAGILDFLADGRNLPEIDVQAEELLAQSLEQMPKPLRRRILLTYLGFPFYDVTTLPLLRNEGLTEYDPIKVDRISPNDAHSIRLDSTKTMLRGTELYNFGAFFSRHYRENDYIWGRLHGAERMIDLICSTLDADIGSARCARFKRDAFLAIIDEELEIGRVEKSFLDSIRAEITQKPD